MVVLELVGFWCRRWSCYWCGDGGQGGRMGGRGWSGNGGGGGAASYLTVPTIGNIIVAGGGGGGGGGSWRRGSPNTAPNGTPRTWIAFTQNLTLCLWADGGQVNKVTPMVVGEVAVVVDPVVDPVVLKV